MFQNMLEKWEDDVREMSEYLRILKKNSLELSEMYYVLNHIGPILGDAELRKEALFSKYYLFPYFSVLSFRR